MVPVLLAYSDNSDLCILGTAAIWNIKAWKQHIHQIWLVDFLRHPTGARPMHITGDGVSGSLSALVFEYRAKITKNALSR
jgi:hypothetical protein